MIKFSDFTIKYGDGIILENQSLEIKNNTFTTLIGESGCGKTSILYHLGLLTDVISGNYYFNDVNLNNLSEDDKASFRCCNLGFVYQEYMLYDHLNVYENLALFAGVINKKLSENEACEYLKQVALDIDLERSLYTLSGGQKQRLAIACVLCKDPQVIILDEPTSALDRENSILLFEVLSGLKEHKTIVVASHSKEALKYSDEIIEIKDGQVNKIKELDNCKQLLIVRKDDNKLPLNFYQNYIKKFKNSTRKISYLMSCLVMITLGLNLVINYIGDAYVSNNKDTLMEGSNGQIFISSKDNYDLKAFDDVAIYPYYNLSFKLGNMEYPIIPYFDEIDMEDKIWTQFNFGGNKGAYLSYRLYLSLKEVLVPSDELEITVVGENGTEIQRVMYSGILKNGVVGEYIADCQEFLYVHHSVIEDMISDDSKVSGYTLFCHSYLNTIDTIEKAESLCYQVVDDFGQFGMIKETINRVDYIRITCCLITIIAGTFLLNILYSSYFEIRQKEFALLKTLGLSNYQVTKLIVLEMLKRILFSTALLLIICLISRNGIMILIISVLILCLSISIAVFIRVKKIVPAVVFRS